MTKKKAIEMAVAAEAITYRKGDVVYPIRPIADRAYDEGLIAGLRKAANLRSVNGRSAGGAISVSRAALKEYARALAKKARAKK